MHVKISRWTNKSDFSISNVTTASLVIDTADKFDAQTQIRIFKSNFKRNYGITRCRQRCIIGKYKLANTNRVGLCTSLIRGLLFLSLTPLDLQPRSVHSFGGASASSVRRASAHSPTRHTLRVRPSVARDSPM